MLFLTSEPMGCAFSSADITGDGMKINIVKELAKGGFSTVRNYVLPEFENVFYWISKTCKIFIMIFRSPVIHIHLYFIFTFFFYFPLIFSPTKWVSSTQWVGSRKAASIFFLNASCTAPYHYSFSRFFFVKIFKTAINMQWRRSKRIQKRKSTELCLR